MDKDFNAYKTIGEVAKILSIESNNGKKLPPHTIRFWEKEFKQLKPKKLSGNRRYYDQKALSILKNIKFLLKEKGLTISDASINKKMKSYVNIFYDILSKIDEWSKMSKSKKNEILNSYLSFDNKPNDLVDYFDNYMLKLSNSTLNSFINV